MDKKSKKARPIDPENQYLFDNEFAVGSMTECTGLIPNAPTDDSGRFLVLSYKTFL